MGARRMISKELDACERRWKNFLATFAIILMLDLVYLFTALPARGARVGCWFIAAASAGACVFALRKLHDAGYLKPNVDSDPGFDDVNVTNLPGPLSLLDLDD